MKFADVQRNKIDHRMAEMRHFRPIPPIRAMAAYPPIATAIATCRAADAEAFGRLVIL
jgi:hypothetical protein